MGQRGQALAEGALALPLLLAAALALVQFALYAHASSVVTGAAQEGARAAAAEGGSLEDGVAHARAVLEAGLGRSAALVDLRLEADGRAGTVSLEATGVLRTVIPWVGDGGLPLRASATVSKEQFRAGAAR